MILGLPIKQIIMRRLRMRLKSPFTTSFGILQNKEFFVIEANDTDGHRGFGESVAFSNPWYTTETVKTTKQMIEDFTIPLLQETEKNHLDDNSKITSAIKRNNMAK